MALEAISEILLPRLLAASLQSTVFVAVVWALCRLLPLPAATRACLWWLVALQLVVGMLWSSPLALPLLPAGIAETAGLAPIGTGALNAATAAVPGPPASAPSALASAAPPTSQWTWMSALAVLWLLGLSIMITRTLCGYLAARGLLRDSQPCRDTTLLRALALAAEAHGLRAPPRLRLSASIESPQLIGPWRPVLLLPAHHLQSMHADELDMALTHELIHLQRGDLWWGLLPAAAQHLFFFHPFAHLAAREYALAREAACDAAVIAGHRHCAHDYGRLLVRLGVARRPSAGLASASPNFHFLKRRLVMLQDTVSTPRVAALLITAAVALLGVVPYRIVAAPLQQTAVAAAVAPVDAVSVAALATDIAAQSPLAPPSVPSAPSPAAAPTPRAAPAPVASPAPLALPAPAAGGTITHGVISLSASSANQAYVLLRANRSQMNGSLADLDEAKRMQRDGEELLWFRKGLVRYVVRDPAILQRFRSTFDEARNLGEAQGALGNRQGELGQQQSQLGMRQGEIGTQLGRLAAEQAERAVAMAAGRDSRPANAAYRGQTAALSAQQRRLSEEMEGLTERQQQLAREQAALSARHSAAMQRAEREAKTLMEEAIAKGVALPVNG